MVFRKVFVLTIACLGLIVAGCASATGSTPNAPQPASVPTTSAPASTPATSSATSGTIRLAIAEGTEARYRVREQLANRNLPGEAVGTTTAVTGAIVVRPNGAIVSDQSKIVVDLQTLRSDESRRDNFIKQNTLQTNQFPTAEFVATEARGLPSTLPASGEATFQLVGDMTVHGVTRPVTWDVTARLAGNDLSGTATTSFKFGDFGMTTPRVAVVLSVEDNIRLEVDFRLVRQS